MNTTEVIELVKAILLCGTAMFAAYVGYQGLETWKRQMTTTARYTVAKEILTAVYTIRSAISRVRDGFMHAHEMAIPETLEANIEKSMREVAGISYAYDRRLEKCNAAQTKLYDLIFEAQIVLDKKVKTTLEPLFIILRDLKFAIREHIQDINPENRDDRFTRDERKRIDSIIFEHGPSDDFSKRIEAVTGEIEVKLLPFIEKVYKSS